jgi:hypothetical protein
MDIILFAGVIIFVWKQAVNIATTDLGSHVKLEVDLKNVNESIDYLLERNGA